MIGSILTFVASPVGRIAAIGLALAVWTAWQRDRAATAARQECRAEQLQKTLDEIARQRDAAQLALADAAVRERLTQIELGDLEKARDEILAKLADAGASCRIPADALQRLRNIR